MSQCPRYLAIEILCHWQQGELPLDALLEPRLQAVADARDRNLLKALVFGVLRQRGALDWVLGRLCKTPLPKLQPSLLQALRVGAYQILWLDRVPLAAAIHSTVEAVKQMGQPRWLTGLVNGVLRNLGRRRDEFLAALAAGQVPAEARHNHPDWLLKRWRRRYGEAGMEAICQTNSQPARLCLRVNTAQISGADYLTLLAEQGIKAAAGPLVPEAIWLVEAGAVTELPGYSAGWFLVQDEIAQAIAGLLLPCPPGNWLDGCAGVGGKTAVMAGLAPAGSRVLAVEPQRLRQALWQENMARLRLPGVALFAGTLAEYAAGPESGGLAAVLIDAPCSGLGVTGRHPDIRWQRQEDELLSLQAKQLAILQAAAPLLAPGGVLVYATCSTEPEENEAVVALFLKASPNFVIENAAGSLPSTAQPLVDEAGFLRTTPGLQGSDGFFAARLRRRG